MLLGNLKAVELFNELKKKKAKALQLIWAFKKIKRCPISA